MQWRRRSGQLVRGFAHGLEPSSAPDGVARAEDFAPTGDLQIGGAGSYGTGQGRTSASGLGTVSLSAFLHHRLLDDDAPLSLQPYLQRTGSVQASVLASGFSTDGPGLSEPYHGTTFGGSLSVDAYTGQVLTLSAAASFYRATTGGAYPGFPGSESLLPRAEFAPGIRVGDTRVSLGYRYAPTITDGSYDGRGFGELFLRFTTVAARRVYLSVLGELILSGGRGRLDVECSPPACWGSAPASSSRKGPSTTTPAASTGSGSRRRA